MFERAFLSDKKHTPDRLTLVLPVDGGEDGLPLSLCRLERDAITDIVGTVRRMQRNFA